MNGHFWVSVGFIVMFIPIYAYGFDWKWGRALVMWIGCVIGGLLAGLVVVSSFGVVA